MNMNPAQRFFPSFCSSGFQFGSISSRPRSLLRRWLRRALHARLLIHFTQFSSQLHKLAEFLCGGERSIVHTLRCGRTCFSVMYRRALFHDEVEPGVSWHSDNDVLVECQAVQLLVTCDSDVCGDTVAGKGALRESPVAAVVDA